MKRKAIISLVRTADRSAGIPAVINLLGINPLANNNLLLKPNFNTADPFPGSTHNDTLANLIMHLKTMSAGTITEADPLIQTP